ncbi:LysM domain-containing protein [Roseovarius marisflavi]|uniref:LysM domain-containing protein n=1 Tax=Roseovarius marisflavi TaxID=1054996 RepID=A0A1M6Y9P1_9RHOB|nr:LysM peptidoglycan-binding domain-containing protein [Roseovarius marisflavi]SHL14990.1 LysM domain-containing protein [Roseovarius marisflavi]
MIRVFLIVSAFFAVTIALILVQPSKPRRSADLAAPNVADVTRADTDLSSLAALAPVPTEPEAVAPAPEAPRIVRSKEATARIEVPQTAAAPAMSPTLPGAPSDLEALIIRALRQGQSESYIHALVNDAAKKGRVEAPKSLVTAEGQVDTALLLATLSESAHTAPEIQTYIVSSGDSLASIAYRFYGRTDAQANVLSANRETLADADRLTVGQVLTLPNL